MVFVSTGVVAEVYEKTEVVMVNCIEESFHSVGILSNVAMVFSTCLDAKLLTVVSNLAAVFSDCGKLKIKTLAVACLCKSVAYVVTHDFTAENLCNIELVANALNFCFVFFGCVIVKVGRTIFIGINIGITMDNATRSPVIVSSLNFLFI